MQDLEKAGLNQGSSGNISLREGDSFLITPTGVPAHELKSELIAQMKVHELGLNFVGPLGPSSEWPFHRAIFQARSDVNAIIHIHAPYVTTLAVLRRNIPAVHYMIAAFGDSKVICTDYAPYGSAELSKLAVEGLGSRDAVLLGNHGAIITGVNMARAMWRAIELEALAKVYYLAQLAGQPIILSDGEILKTIERFQNYGVQSPGHSRQ